MLATAWGISASGCSICIMRFRVVSIGAAVPQDDFDAKIQSIFDTSLNLQLKSEDRLITVFVSDHYDLPQGIRLDGEFPLQSLNAGLYAASRGGILRFDSSTSAIDLRGAPIWEGRLPDLPASVEQACLITWKTINREQRLKGTQLIAEELFRLDQGSMLTRKLSQPVFQLIMAAERLDACASQDAVHKIIGLGPGVTPSGDDILIGFLAGLHSLVRNEKERQIFIQTFGKAILVQAKETNAISRTYLYHAVKGEFSSSIVELVGAIRDGDVKRLLSAVGNAMNVGHSSGMDSITGLLIGLAAWGASSFYFNYKEVYL
jgi:hypothetical protein